MPPELLHRRYLDGIALFNAGAFFEAHEVWEDAWRDASGIEREFLQGLIQCAVALEHYRRSNPRGVAAMYQRYLRRFARVPSPQFMGLDVSRFLADMRRALAPVLDAKPLPEHGKIELDPRNAPQIVLSNQKLNG